jgi:hypothetical protein
LISHGLYRSAKGLNLKGLSLFLRLYTTAQSSSIPTYLSVLLTVSALQMTIMRGVGFS